MRLRRTPRTQSRQRTDSFKSNRHTLAIDRIGLVHEFGQELGKTSGVLQPLGGLVQEIVGGGFGFAIG
jgi:hypothetical protein